VILVLSASWTNPCYDADFFSLARALEADLEAGLSPRNFETALSLEG
jgi:hypothetical protein